MKFGIRNLFNTSTNAYKTKIVAGNHSSERSEITLKDLSDAAASNKFLAVSSIKLDEGKSVNEITNLEEVKSQESLEEVKSQESLAKSNSLDSLKLMSGRRVGIYIPGPESVKVEPIMEDPAISLIAYQNIAYRIDEVPEELQISKVVAAEIPNPSDSGYWRYASID